MTHLKKALRLLSVPMMYAAGVGTATRQDMERFGADQPSEKKSLRLFI
ncbi:hypothetical protein MHZ90_21930 [Pantoea sp. ACRSH]|nr:MULTISPECIES: hypothetical protein [unclassified Pantoea]MCG7368749.1 hypothetical protein [Pantoea sp. ACRSH]MCG7399142.1 hypothetical protein [Pantoea sp. ACRSC]